MTSKIIKQFVGTTLAGVLAITAPVSSLMLTTAAHAETNPNLDAATKLNAFLAHSQSMTANFTQTTTGAASSNAISGNGTFSGTMSVQKPNKFRWHTTSPDEQLIVADGQSLWIYDKQLKQATKQAVGNQISDTPALLLSGNPDKIADNFEITQPVDGTNYFELHPKSSSADFKSLSISFSGGKPVLMVLKDNLGQSTTIKFSNITLDPTISNSKFNFTPPDGVDVINQ